MKLLQKITKLVYEPDHRLIEDAEEPQEKTDNRKPYVPQDGGRNRCCDCAHGGQGTVTWFDHCRHKDNEDRTWFPIEGWVVLVKDKAVHDTWNADGKCPRFEPHPKLFLPLLQVG